MLLWCEHRHLPPHHATDGANAEADAPDTCAKDAYALATYACIADACTRTADGLCVHQQAVHTECGDALQDGLYRDLHTAALRVHGQRLYGLGEGLAAGDVQGQLRQACAAFSAWRHRCVRVRRPTAVVAKYAKC